MENQGLYSREEYMYRIENQKIEIFELIKYMLSKWKIGLGLCIVFFLICICFVPFILKKDDSTNTEIQLEQLTEEQQNKIENILRLYDELKVMMDYENTSAYMNLNPYNCNVTTLQYIITDKTSAGNSFKAYKAFIDSAKFKKVIEDELGKKVVKPSELVTYNVYEQTVFGEGKVDIDLSQILSMRIVTSDESINNELVLIVKKLLDEYHNYLLTTIKEHDIKLLSEDNFWGTDLSIRDKQNTYEVEMDRRRVQINNIKAELDNEEKAALEQLMTDEKEIEEEIVSPRGFFSGRVVILAVIMSLVLSCFIIACYYIFFLNNRIKNGEDIVSIFGLSCIGDISKKRNTEEGLIIQEEIGIRCISDKTNKIFMSMLTDSESIKSYIEAMKGKLKEKGIELVVGENISQNIEAMKIVQSCKKVIFVSESRKTTYRSIDKVLQKCIGWGIDIVGVVNFEK